MTRLTPLYHWSPRERREAIRSEGLRPYSDPTVCAGDVRYPYISMGVTPRAAWRLSGAMEWVASIDEWDLWEVWPGDDAEVHVRPQYGALIEEVKVYTPVPVDRVWYAGTRKVEAAEAIARA